MSGENMGNIFEPKPIKGRAKTDAKKIHDLQAQVNSFKVQRVEILRAWDAYKKFLQVKYPAVRGEA